MSGARLWVVQPGDGPSLAAVVRAAGGDDAAIADGRVFVGRIRATSGEASVTVGDEVRVALPAGARASSRDPEIEILVRTTELLAVHKPAGIPTIPDHGGAAHALVTRAARAIAVDPARLHPTSRLDREVSGVVIFALTPAAATRLAEARARGTYVRRYVALAARSPEPERGTWTGSIGRAADPRKRKIDGREATHAETGYRVVGTAGDVALLALAPRTGRTHQLRVHASAASAPLLGDRAYGGPPRLVVREGPSAGRVLSLARVALHCARVVVDLPSSPSDRTALEVEAKLPPELAAIWSALGGDPEAWDTALSCEI